ncbi:hypothetical protein [Microtetraspora malaysiensis]|uniref:Uncharacterized protein n=1 Tax=Microtetraspora malaysiensis TaxID=161358 RepID=A0ABW6T391_9ACTN
MRAFVALLKEHHISPPEGWDDSSFPARFGYDGARPPVWVSAWEGLRKEIDERVASERREAAERWRQGAAERKRQERQKEADREARLRREAVERAERKRQELLEEANARREAAELAERERLYERWWCEDVHEVQAWKEVADQEFHEGVAIRDGRTIWIHKKYSVRLSGFPYKFQVETRARELRYGPGWTNIVPG